MNIELIDVDGHNFPNLALMKLSAYHKMNGDEVNWYSPLNYDVNKKADMIYMSKVFTFTKDYEYPLYAEKIVKGGTGYKIYEDLPEEIENTFPDYSIYPQYDFAIGFLTRGCIRSCPWCVVPKKEGYIKPAATWQKIKRQDSNKIVFLDNNVLACNYGIAQIEELGCQNIHIDFNQGLDARLITKDVTKLLSKCKWIKYIRLACDTSEMLPIIEQAVSYMKEAGIAKSRFWAYALIQDVEEAHQRILKLNEIGVKPFAQPYRDYEGGEPTQEQKDLARWCNNKAIFNSCKFEDYKPRKL